MRVMRETSLDLNQTEKKPITNKSSQQTKKKVLFILKKS